MKALHIAILRYTKKHNDAIARIGGDGSIFACSTIVQRQQYKWAFMMGITMLLPGFIESIYWIASCFCGEKDANCHKCCQWIFFYNPFLFPFTSIAW